MPFKSHKSSAAHDSGSFWTSYSDLFLGMSVIFLLLYVVTSLRTGTDGLRGEIENKRLQQKVEDLQNQLKAYDAVKQDYLKTQASQSEEKVYAELMDKLTLLKDESQDEKNQLQQKINQNQQKEEALNQYQQMIRNVINSNLMAKTKIRNRENMIAQQDDQIKVEDQQVNNLKTEVDQKTNEIAKDQAEMQSLTQTLNQKMAEYKKAVKLHHLTQAEFKKKSESLKAQNAKDLAALQSRMNEAQAQAAQEAAELEKTKQALATEAGQAATLAKQTQNLKGQLGQVKAQAQEQLGEAKAQAQAQLTEAQARAQAQLGEAKAQADAQQKQLGEKISNLGGQLKQTEGELAKAKAEADARKAIARDIKAGFAKAGIDADVDPGTGDVVINFGNVYFEVGSAQLKEQMKAVLQKAMPVYSSSLLGNPKVSSKISAVEIIGFASPTYKGKFVDPSKLSVDGRAAVNYNLDLSFNRAKSIFNYIFDEDQMHFAHQKELLPLIKVTGRSFLAEKVGRTPTSTSASEFCSDHSCKEAQRVIIRFNFDDKK